MVAAFKQLIKEIDSAKKYVKPLRLMGSRDDKQRIKTKNGPPESSYHL